MKKGLGAFNAVIIVGLLVIFFIIMFSVFFGDSGAYGVIASGILKVFDITPDRDPFHEELSFYQKNDIAKGVADDMVGAFIEAAKSDKKICISEFPVFSKGFFEQGYSINIAKETDGGTTPKVVINLYQTKIENLDNDEKKKTSTLVPVILPVIISGYSPCVIYGETETFNFFNAFMRMQDDNGDAKAPRPEVYTYYGKEADAIYLGKLNTIQMSFGSDRTDPLEFFSGEDNTKYYVVKLSNGGDGYLCLIPTDSDGLFSGGCSKPSGGFIDEDCLDVGTDNSLPNNLLDETRLKTYYCSDET